MDLPTLQALLSSGSWCICECTAWEWYYRPG